MSGILEREPESLLSHLPEGPRELDRLVLRTLRKDRDERCPDRERRWRI